jgi:hypothetical protein
MTYPTPKIIAGNQRLMDYYASQLWHNGFVPFLSYRSGQNGPENMAIKKMHEDGSLPHAAIGKIMRTAAREWKRPFIEMYYTFPNKHHHMSIWLPRVNYLATVIAPLVLTAKPWHTQGALVVDSSDRYATKHVYSINDHDFSLAYLEHLKLPDVRKALKIPADVEPIPLW